MKHAEPKIQQLTERTVAFVSYTGNYMGNAKVFADLFKMLCGWAEPKGLMTPATLFLSSYQDDPNLAYPDELKLDVCMSIPENTVVEGEVQKKNYLVANMLLCHVN